MHSVVPSSAENCGKFDTRTQKTWREFHYSGTPLADTVGTNSFVRYSEVLALFPGSPRAQTASDDGKLGGAWERG